MLLHQAEMDAPQTKTLDYQQLIQGLLNQLSCPITTGRCWHGVCWLVSWLLQCAEVFEDPHIPLDGHTYERSAILKWFETSTTSPLTNARLRRCELTKSAERDIRQL